MCTHVTQFKLEKIFFFQFMDRVHVFFIIITIKFSVILDYMHRINFYNDAMKR